MVAALLILDGASEPLRRGRTTSLERASTPALDALAARAALARVQTVAPGLPVGSESAIPALLGWTPPAPVDRGLLEAAARAVELPAGHRAWRVDAVDARGHRAGAAATARVVDRLRRVAPQHSVRHIGGHRMLMVGPVPLPVASGRTLRVWPTGVIPRKVLDTRTVMVSALGAAAGVARLMGARVVVPDGATGWLDTDLTAKGAHAADAIRGGARRVVVHVAAPDEAAHLRNPSAKIAAIERVDRELVPQLVEAVVAADGILQICADHACDPASGLHDAAPVPGLTWTPGDGLGRRLVRFTERMVAGFAPVDAEWASGRVTA